MSPRPDDRWSNIPTEWWEYGLAHLRHCASERWRASNGSTANPMLAASHFSGCLRIATSANRQGFHAVALALARQAMEAQTLIEMALLTTPEATELLEKHADDSLKIGFLRKHLEAHSWSNLPATPWGISWSEHMTSLAQALQPYAHASQDLLQWTMAYQPDLSGQAPRPNPERGLDGKFIVSVEPGVVDIDKQERLYLLLGIFLFNALVLLDHFDGLSDVGPAALTSLTKQLEHTRWLDHGLSWSEQLYPHVWFFDRADDDR